MLSFQCPFVHFRHSFFLLVVLSSLPFYIHTFLRFYMLTTFNSFVLSSIHSFVLASFRPSFIRPDFVTKFSAFLISSLRTFVLLSIRFFIFLSFRPLHFDIHTFLRPFILTLLHAYVPSFFCPLVHSFFRPYFLAFLRSFVPATFRPLSFRPDVLTYFFVISLFVLTFFSNCVLSFSVLSSCAFSS